jgi:hypothetical protein
MGDWFQHVVDLDASTAEAPLLQDHLHAWLVQHGIIASTRSPCVLDALGRGYAPGPRYPLVVDATLKTLERTNALQIKGVVFCTGRTVFDSGQGRVALFCPGCHGKDPDDHAWTEAVTEWFEGGRGLLACAQCHTAHPITEWIFEPAWGFSSVGCTFWNWPPLKPSFVADIARVLGHRIRYIAGKL